MVLTLALLEEPDVRMPLHTHIIIYILFIYFTFYNNITQNVLWMDYVLYKLLSLGTVSLI